MPIRVYTYGLLPPTENPAVVTEQMSLAHKYNNVLIELELERRKNVRAALSTHPDVAQAEELANSLASTLEASRAEINEHKRATRSTEIPVHLKELVDDVKRRLREARTALKTAKGVALADVSVQEKLNAVTEENKEKTKRARAACGVYWGTYLLIESAVEAARASVMDPSFVRWTGNGKIGVQISGGLSTEAVFGDDRKFRIDPLPENAPSKRKAMRTTLHMRVGSIGRDPLWASFPMIMHRELPKGLVKSATVFRTRVANRDRWELQLTVDVDEGAFRSRGGTATVGVDLGWRQMPDGDLRVAALVDEEGHESELRVPAAWLSKIEHVRSLRAIRDRNLEEAKAAIIAALDAGFLTGREDAPEKQHVLLWRNPKRVSWFAHTFKDVLPAEKTEWLLAWVKQDIHLWQWEAFERRRCMNVRRELYRVFSAKVAEKYGTIVVEDFDLRVFARRGKPEEGTRDARGHHDNRTLADASGFRHILTNAVVSRGGSVVKVNPAYTTKRCFLCAQVDTWDAAATLVHRCSGCGIEWDQDMNAARNILRTHVENPPALLAEGEGAGISKRRESRLLGKQKIREKKEQEKVQETVQASAEV